MRAGPPTRLRSSRAFCPDSRQSRFRHKHCHVPIGQTRRAGGCYIFVRVDETKPGMHLSAAGVSAVLAVTRALAAPFDLNSLLAEITAAACQVLDAERSSVWLHDAATEELFVEVATDLGRLRLPVGVGLVGTCARDRRLINVPDCYADPRFDAAVDRQSGFHTRCTLTLPLVDHRGVLVGVMQVLNKRSGVFGPEDEALAEAVAAQCAVALTRVRMTADLIEGEKLRHEIELARELQLSTLPAVMPTLPGYDMHATFLPASMTGGDTYDLALDERGLLIVLGDATGHGVAPAVSVMQMHAMLRMALRLGTDLETAFRHVNDQLAETLPTGHFVTAFIGLLDARQHRVRFLSGGQGPILHYQSASRRCLRYKATSFPMGAMPLPGRVSALEIALAPGDILALLSDGIFEYEDRGGRAFGVQRVEQILDECRHESPETTSARLMHAVRAFADGAVQEDDVTIVLVKRDGAPDA
ncbi:GAF domain-containing SpoIIE family protein phosphatase [Niveibacterium sp. SC-1]|uniref:PP2C family protein-serine/threonine phosphatase n=1 Tax=Niveibacterium sp. SC-1 TaxID=3135646 RepID=UPI00311DD231